jgi:hypothetical protein
MHVLLVLQERAVQRRDRKGTRGRIAAGVTGLRGASGAANLTAILTYRNRLSDAPKEIVKL